jgi:hypothetical protein
MAAIDIVLRDGQIWMPVDYEITESDRRKDNTLTWNVWNETKSKSNEETQTLERTRVLDAKWIVSFRDGTTFAVKQRGESPDVRSGEVIDFGKNPPRGRYSYRFAIELGGRIYGVFDCPSIIIT